MQFEINSLRSFLIGFREIIEKNDTGLIVSIILKVQ